MSSFMRRTGNSIQKRLYRIQSKALTKSGNKACVDFGITQHDPLVSIISINYNGDHHLCSLFYSLLAQSYKNYELIIVDNNSTDNSDSTIRSFAHKFTSFTYLKSDKNLGFAEGNNHAAEHAYGEYIALLNNDTRVDPEWLRELVTTLKTNGKCAAATSKTLFWEAFQDITIHSNSNFTINCDSLQKSLEYNKYFIRTGKIKGNCIVSQRKTIVISLPAMSTALRLIITTNKPSDQLTIKIGTALLSIPCDYTLDISRYSSSGNTYIINNAGSSTDRNMLPIDRGYGEYDHGQYNAMVSLPYCCGCSVLLRRAAMLQRKLLISELFAYYEDSELSRWLTNAGYTIIYNPKSIVYHKHASTTTEGSPLSKLLWKRNHAIFSAGNNLSLIKKSLADISSAYQNLNNQYLSKRLIEYDNTLLQRLDRTKQLYECVPAIGIYNSNWTVYDKHTQHALSMAAELLTKGTVYLISETDFNIAATETSFSTDLSPCRKLVISNFNTSHTRIFDLLIDASNPSTLAPHNYS